MMRHAHQLPSLVMALIGTSLLTLSCSGGDRPAPLTESDEIAASNPAATDAGFDSADAAGMPHEAPSADSAAADSPPPADFAVVPDPGCIPATGQRSVILPASLFPPAFDRLSAVGPRMVAGGSVAQGIVAFDPGSPALNPGLVALGANFNLFAASEERIGMIAGNAGLVFQQYDAFAEAVGEAMVLADTPADALTITGAGGRWLVAWAVVGSVHARVVDSDGAGAQQVLLPNAYQGVIHLESSPAESGFAVAIASDVEQKRVTRVVRLADDGTVTGTTLLPPELPSHALEKIVPWGSGHALLLSAGMPERRPMVALLDAAGHLSVFALEGGLRGSDVATGDGVILVAAMRSSGEPQVRVFNSSMQPAGPWICLDAPADSDDVLGVAYRPTGFAAVYRSPDGSASLILEPSP